MVRTNLQASVEQSLLRRHRVDLRTFMADRRRAGDGWERVARRLAAETGVLVSRETVRRWGRSFGVV